VADLNRSGKMRAFVTVIVLLATSSCTLYVPGVHPLLIVPDDFRGEIMLVGDKQGGVQWTGAPLIVPGSGALRISNLEALAAIRPDAFEARYSSGRQIGNRNRGGDWDVVGLWPILVMGDDHETVLIYFVIGTFHSKTGFENYRMQHDWKPTLDQIRGGKIPNR
jgi:hypothetical protein